MSASCPPPAAVPLEGVTPFPPAPILPPTAPQVRQFHTNPPVSRRAVAALAGLLALAAAMSLAGLLYWRLAPGAPPPPPRPAPVSPPPTTIESAMPLLQAQAERWLPGASPTMISMQIDWPWTQDSNDMTAIPPGGWINTVFVAPWQPPIGKSGQGATLSMLYDRGSGEIVGQSVLSWETPPAQPPAWSPPPIDSTAALVAAEDAAGRQFRSACPEQRHTTRISLLDRASDAPNWLVDYDDMLDPQARGLVIRIDATSGEIIAVLADAPPCSGQPGADQPLPDQPGASGRPDDSQNGKGKPRRKKQKPESSGG